MKKSKTVHTTHVPSPQSGHGVTNLPELQSLRRLRFAAQIHHGRTRNWERSSFTGKGQDWKPDSACRARNSKAPEWRAPLADSISNCCTRPAPPCRKAAAVSEPSTHPPRVQGTLTISCFRCIQAFSLPSRSRQNRYPGSSSTALLPSATRNSNMAARAPPSTISDSHWIAQGSNSVTGW